MQKEVEIKIKIDKRDVDILNNWLNLNTKFLGVLKITDYYLNNPDSSFYSDSPKGYKEALNFLRIRITDKDSFITFKKRNIDKEGETLSVNEVETKIGDGNKTIEIFKQLNFSDTIELKKKRYVYIYDIFEIVLDEVEGLGSFIEIELKNYSGEVKPGIQKIYDLLKTIGIKNFVQYDYGYITIFLNPDYNFGKEVKL